MALWLAAGTAAATSSTRVTLADGEEARVSLFVAGSGTASIPGQAYALVMSDEGGSNADTIAAVLWGSDPNARIRGAGEYYVVRPALPSGVTAVGVNSSVTPA